MEPARGRNCSMFKQTTKNRTIKAKCTDDVNLFLFMKIKKISRERERENKVETLSDDENAKHRCPRTLLMAKD